MAGIRGTAVMKLGALSWKTEGDKMINFQEFILKRLFCQMIAASFMEMIAVPSMAMNAAQFIVMIVVLSMAMIAV